MQAFGNDVQTLLYLLNCAANGKTPQIDKLRVTEELYNLSCSHMVSAMIAHALTPLLDDLSLFTEEQKVMWLTAKNNSIRRSVLYAAERKRVFGALEQRHIPYMPLKGSVLIKYYPLEGLRELSDVDIWFDRTRAGDVREMMLSLGFTEESYGETHHDTYSKLPIYEFEMHRELFKTKYENLYRYYSDVEKRLIAADDGSSLRHFSPDDFYIFLLAHACKHYGIAGIGVRTLADLYLYEKKELLNFGYIRLELEKMGISELGEQLIRLSRLLLSEKALNEPIDLTDADRETLAFIIKSGASGTTDNMIVNRIKSFSKGDGVNKRTKASYLMSRLFLKPEEYEKSYPFFYRHRWARPFLIFARIPKALTVKRKSLKKELDIIKKT